MKECGSIPGRQRYRIYGTEGSDCHNGHAIYGGAATYSEPARGEDGMRYPWAWVLHKTGHNPRYAPISIGPVDFERMNNAQEDLPEFMDLVGKLPVLSTLSNIDDDVVRAEIFSSA